MELRGGISVPSRLQRLAAYKHVQLPATAGDNGAEGTNRTITRPSLITGLSAQTACVKENGQRYETVDPTSCNPYLRRAETEWWDVIVA